MAHSHYVLDLYYPTDHGPDMLRREVMRIEARTDQDAIAESIRVSAWRHPARFDVRAIVNSARSADRLVHSTTMPPAPQPGAAPLANRTDLQGPI